MDVRFGACPRDGSCHALDVGFGAEDSLRFGAEDSLGFGAGDSFVVSAAVLAHR